MNSELTRQSTTDGPSTSRWQGGWHRQAQWCMSPNWGPRPIDTMINLIVIHSISLPPGEFENGQVQRLFSNELNWDAHPYFQTIRDLKVSAHFFISRSGVLWQFVDCEARAWHAGPSNYQGRKDCNNYSIGIELEGVEGELFEAPQYHTLTQLCKDLIQHYPIAHIAGHEHIAPGRKQDPGAGFDWTLLQKMLKLEKEFFPASF